MGDYTLHVYLHPLHSQMVNILYRSEVSFNICISETMYGHIFTTFETFTGFFLDRRLCHIMSCSEKSISYIYNTLQTASPLNSTLIKTKQEEEEGSMGKILEHIYTCSSHARHCLIHFNILCCLHYSKERVHKIQPEISTMCDRCLL